MRKTEETGEQRPRNRARRKREVDRERRGVWVRG